MPYIYRVDRDGKLLVVEDPGGVCMSLGATAAWGRDAKPVTMIDWTERVFRREGGDIQELPTSWYRAEDLLWDYANAVGQGE